MVVPRSMHTATLLPRFGLVLLAGGVAAGDLVAQTELADPSGPWTVSGQLAEARYGHTATLLRDGTVLVTGGFSPKGGVTPTATAEVYDPSRGSWTATGRMGSGRAGHTATLLRDGTVLVAGGASHNGGNGSPLPAAEVYDPRRGTWRAVGDMIDARAGHTATALPDGRVLVVGGVGTETEEVAPINTALATAELYDPARRKWAATGSLHEGRAKHTATLLQDGAVLVTRTGRLGSAELFDPGRGSWTTTGNMAAARIHADGDAVDQRDRARRRWVRRRPTGIGRAVRSGHRGLEPDDEHAPRQDGPHGDPAVGRDRARRRRHRRCRFDRRRGRSL